MSGWRKANRSARLNNQDRSKLLLALLIDLKTGEKCPSAGIILVDLRSLPNGLALAREGQNPG